MTARQNTPFKTVVVRFLCDACLGRTKEYAASASILPGERVCFNIKGNTYRLIVLINYAKSKIYIKWVGTHAEYDKIDAKTVTFGGG